MLVSAAVSARNRRLAAAGRRTRRRTNQPPRRPVTRTAWRASLEAQNLVLRVLEADMHDRVGISLAWYDVLLHLHEAPGGRLRMNELADLLVLSRSWLTRRVEAMEKDGLVRRDRVRDDARGIVASLTPEGRRVYGRAARLHREAVRELVLAHLSDAEARTIEACFDRIAEAARRRLAEAP
jgi:DNA-binding MarR family transcriptional regulator